MQSKTCQNWELRTFKQPIFDKKNASTKHKLKVKCWIVLLLRDLNSILYLFEFLTFVQSFSSFLWNRKFYFEVSNCYSCIINGTLYYPVGWNYSNISSFQILKFITISEQIMKFIIQQQLFVNVSPCRSEQEQWCLWPQHLEPWAGVT